MNATEIGVRVLAGVVTSTGQVPSELAKRNVADSISVMRDVARRWFSAN